MHCVVWSSTTADSFLAGKLPITSRHTMVASRPKVGHWEVDTMLGAGQAGPCVLTVVERKTGYEAIGKLPSRATTHGTADAQRSSFAVEPRRRPDVPLWTTVPSAGTTPLGRPTHERAQKLRRDPIRRGNVVGPAQTPTG